MGNVKLSEEQIKHLKDYIKTKGFRDPVVIAEILDHFACKVEDTMEAIPGINFYDAIPIARRSFGIKGFYPIAKALENHTTKKYRRIYWQSMGDIIKSVKYLPLLLISGWIGYQSWMWCAINNYELFETNLYTVILTIAYFLVMATLSLIYTRRYNDVFHVKMGMKVGVIFPLYVIWINMDNHHNHLPIHALIIALATVYALLHFISKYKVASIALSDYKAIEQFVEE